MAGVKNRTHRRCRGKVLRVERSAGSGKIGIGAAIGEHEFVKDV